MFFFIGELTFNASWIIKTNGGRGGSPDSSTKKYITKNDNKNKKLLFT